MLKDLLVFGAKSYNKAKVITTTTTTTPTPVILILMDFL